MPSLRFASALSLSLLIAHGVAAEPLHLTRLRGDGAGTSYWSRAGDWFYV
jgi:hypothetical protein